jgi:hypothetical protein
MIDRWEVSVATRWVGSLWGVVFFAHNHSLIPENAGEMGSGSGGEIKMKSFIIHPWGNISIVLPWSNCRSSLWVMMCMRIRILWKGRRTLCSPHCSISMHSFPWYFNYITPLWSAANYYQQLSVRWKAWNVSKESMHLIGTKCRSEHDWYVGGVLNHATHRSSVVMYDGIVSGYVVLSED